MKNDEFDTTEDLAPDASMFSLVSDGVVLTGTVGDRPLIAYVNTSFVELTGYSRQELIGQDYDILEGEGTDRHAVEFLRRSLKNGLECKAIVRHYRKDGTPFWHEMILSPLRAPTGEVRYSLGVHREIAGADAGPYAGQPGLDDVGVTPVGRELNANVIHDIRGSLSAMLSFLTLLGETLSEPRQLEWLQAIERNGKNCVTLLDQRAANREVAAAFPGLTDQLVRFRDRVNLSGYRILIADDDEDICLSVREILQKAGARVVAVGDGARVVETVLDGVAGRHAFDLVIMDMHLPLKSGYEATAELRRRGYLGVIVAFTAAVGQQIIERCLQAGCDVYVAKSFSGSRLSALVLNCCERRDRHGEEYHEQLRSSPSSPGCAPKRILIVDDSVDTAKAMAALLERGGHRTRTATDGLAALEVSRSFSPEIALIDLCLPGMDGHALLARLRESHANMTAFAVSGLESLRARRQAMESGFDELFVKPVDVAALERAIAGSRTADDVSSGRRLP